MTISATADATSTNILAIANHPILWVFVLGLFAVIIVQTIIYMRAARRVAPAVGVTQSELRTSFRAGAVASLGPSLAVALVAVALLALFGTPAVLTRIGLIGSVPFETGAASIAAGTMDADLGGPTYTQEVFVVAFAAMSLGGVMWILATLVLTPILKRGDDRMRRMNPHVVAILPAAALLGAFFALGLTEVPKSGIHALTLGISGATMAICLALARWTSATWLREWGLGLSILVGLTAAYLLTSTVGV